MSNTVLLISVELCQVWLHLYLLPFVLMQVSTRGASLLLSPLSFCLGQSISTLALDCLLLIQCHSTVTVYSHGYWSLVMHQTARWRRWKSCSLAFKMVDTRAGACWKISLLAAAQEGNLCGLCIGGVLQPSKCVTSTLQPMGPRSFSSCHANSGPASSTLLSPWQPWL